MADHSRRNASHSKAIPSTPQRPSSHQSSTESILLSRGTRSNVASAIITTQEYYRPFLKEDIKSRTKIDLDTFVYCISNRKKDDSIFTIIQELVKNKRLRDKFMLYQDVKGVESEQYNPFANLANLAMQLIKQSIKRFRQPPGSDVVFCVHDRMAIRASRKPDGIILNRNSVDNKSDTVSRQPWTRVIAFVEHKTLKDEMALKMLPDSKPTKATEQKFFTEHAASKQVQSAHEQKGQKGAPHFICMKFANVEAHSHSGNDEGKGKLFLKKIHANALIARSTSSIDPSAPPSPTTQLRRSSRVQTEETQPTKLWRSLSSLHLKNETVSIPAKLPSTFSSAEDRPPPDDPPTYEEQLIPCASYAFELLSNGLVRTHALGFLVSNTRIEPFYYDRSLIVSCTPFDLVQEREKFLQVILCLALLSQAEWGIAGWFKHSEYSTPQTVGKVSNDKFNGSTIKLQNGDKLIIQDTLYRQHGLIGRGTHVYRARWFATSGKEKGNVIVKFSWAPETRTAESVFVNTAREFAEKHHPSMLDHLPNILYSEESKPDPIQLRLKEVLGDEYELRVRRLTIHDELFPITELKTAEDMLQAMREIFKCYQWLYENMKIMHRDISLNNLMFRKRDGKFSGVLNDMDLAIFSDAIELSSKQRTGTKPFLAIDLLEENPPKHMYRHDLESFFYVFVWIVFRYHNGVESNTLFQDWILEDYKNLRRAKVDLISDGLLGHPTPNYTKLRGHLMDMQDALWRGRQARRVFSAKVERGSVQPSETFDEETLGGNVSFEVFQAILEKEL